MERIRRAATNAAMVCVIGVGVLASLAGAQQQPVFRSRVEVVQLDVSVLDRNRHPVRGLTQDDFTILEDGKPRKIVGFTAFDIGDEAPSVNGWMRDIPPDVTTNDLKPESRLFVIVIDDGLIPQDPFFIKSSKQVLNSIIEKIGPDDLTAIVFTGDNRKTQDFTTDKKKLLATVEKFSPGLAGYLFGMETFGVDVDVWFYQSATRTLGAVTDYLAGVPNRRKAVFWLSPGVPMDMNNCGAVNPRPSTRGGSGDFRQKSDIQLDQGPECLDSPGMPPSFWINEGQRLTEIFRRAQRANVTMYPVDPGGVDGMRGFLANRLGPINDRIASWKATMQQDFLAMTAANTGGRTVMNTNEFEPGIRDIFAENTSYYLIAFEPATTQADGKLHKIQVKVNREDVDVRTRSGYYAPEPEDPKSKKAEVSPESAALAKSIGGLLPASDLPMKVALAPFAVPGQRLATVAIVLGVREPIPEAAAKSRIDATTELQISAFTPEGDPRGTQRHTAKVTLRAGSGGDAQYEVLGRIDLPAGRYRLRLAAHNVASKKDGSVFADVVVPDYSNLPVSASPIVLSATPALASAPRDLLKPVLPIAPTAERTFAITDRATAFLRLYQSGAKPVERATVAIRIRNAGDAVLVDGTQLVPVEQFVVAGQKLLIEEGPADISRSSARMPPGATRPTTSKDQFANLSLRSADVSYPIPLPSLRPGPHLLTMEVTMGATVIRRDVRFEVSGPQVPGR